MSHDSLECIRDQLEKLCVPRGWDYGIKADAIIECLWNVEIRITKKPNEMLQPDLSHVAFLCGDPLGEIAQAACDAVIKWALETEQT